MSGFKRTAATDQFDYFSKVDGQVVHCERAAFISNGGVPVGWADRVQLGFQLGVGLVSGGVFTAGGIALASKALGALFS